MARSVAVDAAMKSGLKVGNRLPQHRRNRVAVDAEMKSGLKVLRNSGRLANTPT